MRNIKDAIKRFFGLFDSNGLRYSTAHYARIHNTIMEFPKEKQARYANRATVHFVKDQRFLKKAFLPYSEKPDAYIFKHFNAISVGNLAYIQLHGPTSHFCNKARTLLNRYRNYLLDNKTIN